MVGDLVEEAGDLGVASQQHLGLVGRGRADLGGTLHEIRVDTQERVDRADLDLEVESGQVLRGLVDEQVARELVGRVVRFEDRRSRDHGLEHVATGLERGRVDPLELVVEPMVAEHGRVRGRCRQRGVPELVGQLRQTGSVVHGRGPSVGVRGPCPP